MILKLNLHLCKLVAESSHFPVGNTDVNINESFLKKEIYFIPPPQEFYSYDMRVVLETWNTLDNLEPKKRKALILKSTAYQLINNVLSRKNMVYYCVVLIMMKLE